VEMNDDDWDALGGASDGTAAAPIPDADPFGGADDPFGAAPEPAPAAEAPVADGGLDEMFGGGDASAAPVDDMFGGTMQGNLMDNTAADEPPAPSGNSMDDMFGDAPAQPAAAPTMVAPEPVPQEDNSLIERWEKTKREELQKRREEGSKKVSAQMEVGKKAIEEFDAKRKADMEKAQAKNRTDEKGTVQTMEAALKAGLVGKDSWEKVCTYLDLSADPKRQNTIARMKSVLIAVKSNPPSDKKNFGA